MTKPFSATLQLSLAPPVSSRYGLLSMARSASCLFVVVFLACGCTTDVVYPTHLEQAAISDVPPDIKAAFVRGCPDARNLNVHKEMGGPDGTQLIFWAFRFEQSGKLREALISRATDKPYVYDVQK